MPSFDIVSKTDLQKLDNAINVAKKEITTRYDFHDSKTEIDFDKKALNIHIITENDLRMKAVQDILIVRSVKQGIDTSCFDFGKDQYAAGSLIKKDIKIKQGIGKETARKIVKLIKDSGLKVQPSIMDDQVRVTGKKIDDLQKIIIMLKTQNLELPLQYENFRN
ncbi:MAG: YajQ family cyclic di-GMP-binding protein [Bacteroidia bacterium]|nr:YajQ family cyclic di-GMP-binding protein [Bacteroidia bacterium]MCZ2278299.1 YajQ family cyclic di-GMP-binding protein [Bacteroidia bacterium]